MSVLRIELVAVRHSSEEVFSEQTTEPGSTLFSTKPTTPAKARANGAIWVLVELLVAVASELFIKCFFGFKTCFPRRRLLRRLAIVGVLRRPVVSRALHVVFVEGENGEDARGITQRTVRKL